MPHLWDVRSVLHKRRTLNLTAWRLRGKVFPQGNRGAGFGWCLWKATPGPLASRLKFNKNPFNREAGGQIMGRRRHRERGARGHAAGTRQAQAQTPLRFARPRRRLLLAGTALATTLLFSGITPAHAQAIFIVSNSSINFTRNSDCVFIGTCLSATTIPFFSPNASIKLTNNGDLATFGALSSTIFTNTFNNNNSPITIKNTGDLATAAFGAVGIFSYTGGNRSKIKITNTGDIATIGFFAHGINGYTTGLNSGISVTNNGEIDTLGANAAGVAAVTVGRNSNVKITNQGPITTKGLIADGIYAYTGGVNSDITIVNSSDVKTRGRLSDGIFAYTYGRGASVTIQNSGSLDARGPFAFGIYALTVGKNSPIDIDNSGDVSGRTAGIYAYSSTSTKITNSGDISAGSGLAIDTEGASTSIYNSGLITGFVDLTGSADRFMNQAGGQFNASGTSDFGGGGDVFSNAGTATVRTASRANAAEQTKFVGLERFENAGLITMVDGRNNDVFRISNTPGGTDLTFVGTGKSELALDAFLGGPGSTADNLIVEGSTAGRTLITVNNTNSSSARFDPVGIPVVFVNGNVDANDFYIDKPIDAGFFEYDLFFVPTGSGFFELKNHTGGGSHLLPHLVTFTHDTFHNTTETWFDQSTDLRAVLTRENACSGQRRAEARMRCEEIYNVTPGLWARGAGSWFQLQDDAVTNANGRTYHHDLDRDLDIWTLESGIDFGKRDLFADGDILVLGVLGGAVESTLNYKALARSFNLSGLEAGAYATYMRGGLFVDTLFKTIFAEVDPNDTRGFPNSLDHTAYGFRTDAGYRFGGMQPGPFIEPLATIAASWTQLDDFNVDGNAVDFDEDENVRGRVGLRMGTSSEVWEGTTMEPFIVGSLWGTLSGAHNATLTSTGRVFKFTDEPEDLWGVVSGGLNFFNPGAQTAVFAKIDYTFADDTQGVGVRGGMRYTW